MARVGYEGHRVEEQTGYELDENEADVQRGAQRERKAEILRGVAVTRVAVAMRPDAVIGGSAVIIVPAVDFGHDPLTRVYEFNVAPQPSCSNRQSQRGHALKRHGPCLRSNGVWTIALALIDAADALEQARTLRRDWRRAGARLGLIGWDWRRLVRGSLGGCACAITVHAIAVKGAQI